MDLFMNTSTVGLQESDKIQELKGRIRLCQKTSKKNLPNSEIGFFGQMKPG